jgi:hypothetical protein
MFLNALTERANGKLNILDMVLEIEKGLNIFRERLINGDTR